MGNQFLGEQRYAEDCDQGGNLTAEPWILTGLNKDDERKGPFSMIDDVQITDSHIMVAGSMAVEDEGTKNCCL